MRRLIPLLLLLFALAAGVAGGLTLRPDPAACAPAGATAAEGAPDEGAEAPEPEPCPRQEVADRTAPTEFADLQRQFVVPLVEGERVAALVVASIAVEVTEGHAEAVFDREPKLRDAFLDVLFVHAHGGGFDGAFTSRAAMTDLKARLAERAAPILGPPLRGVLITEIVRQDL